MNVGISVSVFYAPGLTIQRKQAAREVESKFRGQNFIMNLDPTVPIQSLNLLSLVTTAAKVSADNIPNLLFLRITKNNKELDITKSLNDNGITQFTLLQLHLIGK